MVWADASVGDWTSIIGTVANIGFSALVGWYLLTKALPKMQDDFLRSLKDQREHFDTTETQRRSEHKDALHAVIQHCERESLRHADVLKVEMSLVTSAIKDQREVMEDVRDALRMRQA